MELRAGHVVFFSDPVNIGQIDRLDGFGAVKSNSFGVKDRLFEQAVTDLPAHFAEFRVVVAATFPRSEEHTSELQVTL